MKNTYVILDSFNLNDLSQNLCVFLRNKKMSAQHFQTDNNKWIVQGREDLSWKKYLSMDKAITVKMSVNGSVLTVEIGEGKWADKAAGAAVGWFLFWPTLVTSAIGTYQQMQLPKEINEYIVKYLSECSTHIQNIHKFCPNCGHEIKNAIDIFCEKCGNQLKD